jgi:hypothetical protein
VPGTFFVSKYWEPISKVSDLKPGDLISCLRPEDNDSANTGHVMIVRDKPIENPNLPGEFLVRVLDASGYPHNEDSRQKGITGLGSGTISIVSNLKGELEKYRWRENFSRTESTRISFGRLVDPQ